MIPSQTVATGRNWSSTSVFGLSWPLLVGGACYLLALDSRLLIDPDTYWHLATAKWMFEHLSIPSADPFSHTMYGAPWVAHEWLSEIFFGLSYQLAGWNGPVMLAAAAYAVTLALLCRYLLRHLEPLYAVSFTALAAFMVADHLLARPHVLAFPLMAAWTIALTKAREEERVPAWPWILLMIGWANLHGSFSLGLGLAIFFAGEAVIVAGAGKRREVAIDWGYFVFSALLASLLTPHGVKGLMFAAHLDGMTYVLDNIGEWRSPDFHKLQPLEVGLMVGAMLIFLRGLRLPPLRAVLLLGLLHLALVHGRHGAVFGLLAPIVVAHSIGEQWPQLTGSGYAGRLDRWFADLATPCRPIAGAAVALVLAGVSYGVGWSDRLRPAVAITPDAAVRAAQVVVPKGKVLNSYGFGGYLIFSGIPPAIDGRADMYGDAFVADYGRAINLKLPGRLTDLLEQRDIEWTLLTPDLPAVALLDHLPGWRRLYADEVAVVHVRTPKN